MRRKIRRLNKSGFLDYIDNQIKNNKTAFNDHNSIWTWGMLRVPYYYFVKIRSNKIRQKFSCGNVR